MTYDFLGCLNPESKVFKGETRHNMVKLHTPVVFTCKVNGNMLTASLTHAEDDLTKWLYHIAFSNGYSAVFTINRERKCFVERGQAIASSYARAIDEDLAMIYQFNPMNPLPFSLSVLVKNEKLKVWAKMEQSGCWGVYFKGCCRFFLHPFTGKWQAETFDIPDSYIIPEIEMAVVRELNRFIRITPVQPPLN